MNKYLVVFTHIIGHRVANLQLLLPPNTTLATITKYRTSLGASENMGQTTAIGNAKTIRPPLALRGALAELHATEATSNHARFLSMRKAGKAYWTAGGGTRFWLTEEGVAERRAEGKTMVPATIDYEEEGQASGTEWKKASVADIEGMLSIGQCIILHNC